MDGNDQIIPRVVDAVVTARAEAALDDGIAADILARCPAQAARKEGAIVAI